MTVATPTTYGRRMEEFAKILTDQAALNRGLWIGLHSGDPLSVAGVGVTDPHCTVLHLGRVNGAGAWWSDDRLLEHVVQTCQSVAQNFTAYSTKVSGLARFASSDVDGNPIVALVPDTRTRSVRELVVITMASLTEVPRGAFTRYDYTPHVTVGRVARDDAWSTPAMPEWPSVSWTHLGVTCGEAHARYPLRGSTS